MNAAIDYDSEPTCKTCGSSDGHWTECYHCGGLGHSDFGELHAVDPFWYDEGDIEECDICEGEGGFWICHHCTRVADEDSGGLNKG